ncbi:hypothetical protein EVG20_g10635 [Dentipellis fragilis]|uniref:Uncharacterized protein n=1 Tax=Dentipellis fragilis TaxID=205917 RepID=A0A4Y9XS84_9AGAM|nr:hypothetical protein EVG20_g10635 [Dentipellis fragilis]
MSPSGALDAASILLHDSHLEQHDLPVCRFGSDQVDENASCQSRARRRLVDPPPGDSLTVIVLLLALAEACESKFKAEPTATVALRVSLSTTSSHIRHSAFVTAPYKMNTDPTSEEGIVPYEKGTN